MTTKSINTRASDSGGAATQRRWCGVPASYKPMCTYGAQAGVWYSTGSVLQACMLNSADRSAA